VTTWLGFGPAERARETLEVSGEGRLVIGAWAGSVNVSAGRRGVVEVALRCRGGLPAPALEIERYGDDVYVEARSAPFLRWLATWGWPKVVLEVSVPTRYSVDVVTSCGSIDIQDVDGQVSAFTSNGTIQIGGRGNVVAFA
jgi:hypothetical protein